MTSLDRHFIPSFNPSIAGRGGFSCQVRRRAKDGRQGLFSVTCSGLRLDLPPRPLRTPLAAKRDLTQSCHLVVHMIISQSTV